MRHRWINFLSLIASLRQSSSVKPLSLEKPPTTRTFTFTRLTIHHRDPKTDPSEVMTVIFWVCTTILALNTSRYFQKSVVESSMNRRMESGRHLQTALVCGWARWVAGWRPLTKTMDNTLGRFADTMEGWGLKDSSAYDCGHSKQTVDSFIESCPQHRPPNGKLSIRVLDDDTIEWLTITELQL